MTEAIAKGILKPVGLSRMTGENKMTKEINFEKAMENLQKIVEELEDGEFSLDNSLKKYEEGIKLVNLCRTKLEKARQKIETITKNKDGEFEKRDFTE